MAIRDYDGTAAYEIGKLRDWDGTATHQIGKVYDNDGTANHLIYSAEEVLITSWKVNDSNAGEAETSQTKSWDVAGYDTAEIIFRGTAYDGRGWPDWTCHNRIVVNGVTHTCNGSTRTINVALNGASTLTVQVISSAWGGGLANAFPVTVDSIKVY